MNNTLTIRVGVPPHRPHVTFHRSAWEDQAEERPEPTVSTEELAQVGQPEERENYSD